MMELPLSYWSYRLLDLPTLLGWVKVPRDAHVLEVGCGTGKLTRHLTRKIPFKKYTAIDLDPQNIVKAEAQMDRNTKIIFQVADVSRLPFEDESFDVVLEMDVLHHVADWKKAIREIHRVLKKNGKLLLRDYSIETFNYPALGLVFQHFFDHPYNHMFDQIELLTYLRKNGFEITHQNDSTWMMLLSAQKKSASK